MSLRVLKVLSIPLMAIGMLTALTATALADHAEIRAALNCTSAMKVCFDLTASTADFSPSTRHFTLTLLGHKKGDQTDTFNAIGSSQDLPLDNNLDDAVVQACFNVTDVIGFDKFRLKIDAVGESLTVNGQTSATLPSTGGFTNNCPTSSTPPPPSPSPSPSAATTTSALAGTGGFDFRFPLIGLVLVVAGGALYLVSTGRGRSAQGK